MITVTNQITVTADYGDSALISSSLSMASQPRQDRLARTVGCMARLARVVVPGLPHHVTQRGNGRHTAEHGALRP